MPREYHMASSLAMGQMGEILAKSVFRAKYPDRTIKDYRNDLAMQHRGIDLYIDDLGFVEVKTDSHKPENIFIELSSKDGPGAIDRSAADWIAVLYFRHQVMYLIPRSWLQFWIRTNLANIDDKRKRTLTSTIEDKKWTSKGVFVRLRRLQKDIPGIRVLTWDDSDEVMS